MTDRNETSNHPFGWTPPADNRKQRLLFFTRSVGYEHAAIRRKEGELGYAERALTEIGAKAGFEVECTKDGRVFDADLDQYDCFAFYTLGDLTRENKRNTPSMTAEGKANFLKAIAAGKGFVGIHAASDTFYSEGVDPYISMLGAEFCGHGPEQEAAMLVKSPAFPGMQRLGTSFTMFEEWYVFKKVHHDMHVILALDTGTMHGNLYHRPNVPATWARMYGEGRVFYTSLGHREEVCYGEIFEQVILGGVSWTMGNVGADVRPNFHEATPNGDYYRRMPVENGSVSR